MGYYSQLSFRFLSKVRVDKEKIREIEKYFNLSNSGFADVKLPVNSEGILEDISLNDYYGKFYDSEEFAGKLSRAIVEGEVELHFLWEDGEYSGCRVSKNQVEELFFCHVTREEWGVLNSKEYTERVKSLKEVIIKDIEKLSREIAKIKPDAVIPVEEILVDGFQVVLETKKAKLSLAYVDDKKEPAYDLWLETLPVEEAAKIADGLKRILEND